MIPGIPADKARNMLLKEERRINTKPTESIGMAYTAIRPPGKRTITRKAAEAKEVLKCLKYTKNYLKKNY